MASYIVKSKSLDFNNPKISIGQFYSGDRFYTLLNEYIDANLKKRNIFLSWIIQILFKSSNFKHDPGIANGQPLSVKIFDWVCISCLIYLALFSVSLTAIIPLFTGKIDSIQTVLLGLGGASLVPAIFASLWLWVYFTVRKKNKALTLQAFVEKKISFCLKFRFLIKNVEIPLMNNKNNHIIVMENFEAQGTQAPRWLNIQMINLICSIFPDFNYIFKFDDLKEEEYQILKPIIEFDFKNIDLIECNELNYIEWKEEEKNNFLQQIQKMKIGKRKKNKLKEIK